MNSKIKRFGSNNDIYICGYISSEKGIDKTTASELEDALAKATGDINIWINSGGGSMPEGTAMYELIRAYNKGKVTAKVLAAASMATIVCCAADRVEISRTSSMFLIHNPAFMFQRVSIENQPKIKQYLLATRETMLDIYSSKSNLSKAELIKYMDVERNFSASEAIKFGFADGYIESEKKSFLENVKYFTYNKKENTIEDELELVAYIDANLSFNKSLKGEIPDNKNTKSGKEKTTMDEKEIKALVEQSVEAAVAPLKEDLEAKAEMIDTLEEEKKTTETELSEAKATIEQQNEKLAQFTKTEIKNTLEGLKADNSVLDVSAQVSEEVYNAMVEKADKGEFESVEAAKAEFALASNEAISKFAKTAKDKPTGAFKAGLVDTGKQNEKPTTFVD
jgi:ATP-dependent protease ClpP protease subunit